MSVERLPFAPLAAACTISSDHGRTTTTSAAVKPTMPDVECAPAVAVAVRLGVNYRTALRWADDGVPFWRADELLTRRGVHPVEVWGADYFGSIANSTLDATPDATARRARIRA